MLATCCGRLGRQIQQPARDIIVTGAEKSVSGVTARAAPTANRRRSLPRNTMAGARPMASAAISSGTLLIGRSTQLPAGRAKSACSDRSTSSGKLSAATIVAYGRQSDGGQRKPQSATIKPSGVRTGASSRRAIIAAARRKSLALATDAAQSSLNADYSWSLRTPTTVPFSSYCARSNCR